METTAESKIDKRKFKCDRCGTVYELVEGTHVGCCVMQVGYRTGGICGGELMEIWDSTK